jgi:hypothetical protein
MSSASRTTAPKTDDALMLAVVKPPAHALAVAGESTPLQRHAVAVVKRLQVALAEETACLTSGRATDLSQFNNRKGQGLLELNTALAAVAGGPQHREVIEQLVCLKAKVDENMRALRLHISALNEITGILTDAIKEAESDGTYSPARGSRRSA